MDYDKTKFQMITYLNNEISRYAKQCGSREALSVKLGHAENFVRKTVGRQSFSALERLWRECREKL